MLSPDNMIMLIGTRNIIAVESVMILLNGRESFTCHILSKAHSTVLINENTL